MIVLPKQQLSIRNHNGRVYKGTVRATNGNRGLMICLHQEDVDDIIEGDEIELEIPRIDDALYVSTATVLKINGKSNLHLRQEESLIHRVQRREAARITVNIAAEYAILPNTTLYKGEVEGLILDISGTGILLAVRYPLVINNRIQLVFRIGEGFDTVLVKAQGVVVREDTNNCTSGSLAWKYRYGIQFRDTSKCMQDKLSEYVLSKLQNYGGYTN